MKISDIIKQSLIERRIITEDEVGQQTRSYDLNNPDDVLNAAKSNECWKQWGLSKTPGDYALPNNYTITYRGQQKTIPKQTRALYDPISKEFYLGEKIQGESDKDNTYFYGFSVENKEGFRWRCNSLRSIEQSGTRNITPVQQKLLDDYLATYGNVYTQIGGKGKVAKDIRELTYKDGTSIWDKNSGIPPEGNFVYIQQTLYNVEPNQLANVADYLKNNGWTLDVPPMTDPKYRYGQPLVSIYPDLGNQVSKDVKVYPTTSSGDVTKSGILGRETIDKTICMPAIKYLTSCVKNKTQNVCQDDSKRLKNVETAAKCYYGVKKGSGSKDSTKLMGGILGQQDELMSLLTPEAGKFGIGSRVRELEASLNESKKPKNIDNTIRKHLLENIRHKNSLK